MTPREEIAAVMTPGVTPEDVIVPPDQPRSVTGKVLGGLAEGAAEWFKFPGRFIRGETGYVPGQSVRDQPEAADWAAGTAMNLIGTGTPFAASGSVGIFGGRLAKTADRNALLTAEKLEEIGAPRERIWSETGWFRGADDKWRFEIPDRQADFVAGTKQLFNAGYLARAKAGEMFRHKPLFEAYPEIGQHGMMLERHTGTSGMFNPLSEQVGVVAPTLKTGTNVALHELQHGVQNVEGFASGGNPKSPAYQKIAQDLRAKAHDEIQTLADDMHAFQKKKLEDQGETVFSAAPETIQKTVDAWRKEFPEKARRYDVAWNNIDLAPGMGVYKRIMGEVESRNVQRRHKMTQAERRATPPWLTEDVPRDLQIAPPPQKMGDLASLAIDPTLYHGLSGIKLPRPVREMEIGVVGAPRTPPEWSTVIKPEALEGSAILPHVSDRSAIGGEIASVGGSDLPWRIPREGGFGFMSRDPAVWASTPGATTRLANRAAKIERETNRPVMLSPAFGGVESVDFTKSMSDVLTGMMRQSSISNKGADAFNTAFRKEIGKEHAQTFPGVRSPELRDWLLDAPGTVRAKFAKRMDTAPMREAGFPSVAEGRAAVSDPRLLDVRNLSSGVAFGRPTGSVVESAHRTYPKEILGEYMGGLGRDVPAEVMFPSIMKKMEHLPLSRQQTSLNFKMPYEIATPRWVDEVSRWLERNPAPPSPYDIIRHRRMQ